MKHILVFAFLFVSGFLSAQKRDGFLSGTLQVDVPEHYQPVVSARLSGGAKLNNLALLGIGIGVTRFKEFQKLYVPVFGTITIADFTKRVSPLAVLEPGYGIYKETFREGNRRIVREGGFTFFGGIGVGVAASKKANLAFSIGYSHYGFTTDNYSFAIKGVGIRFTATAL